MALQWTRRQIDVAKHLGDSGGSKPHLGICVNFDREAAQTMRSGACGVKTRAVKTIGFAPDPDSTAWPGHYEEAMIHAHVCKDPAQSEHW